jgi:hypothetical protein
MASDSRYREDGTREINLTIDREAIAWLRLRAPNRKGYGQFVSRLLYQDRELFEGRTRQARQERAGALAGAGDGEPST